jgi:hypothetical protein
MINGLLMHIWGNICAFPHILGSPSSYLTFQLLHFDFLIYEENLIFFFSSVGTFEFDIKTSREMQEDIP